MRKLLLSLSTLFALLALLAASGVQALMHDKLLEPEQAFRLSARALDGAMLRANRFIDENRAETIKVLLQWVKQTPEIAARSYDVELKSILRDGTMTDAEMESFIDRLGHEKKRSIDDVRDFSFVRQVWKELESAR